MPGLEPGLNVYKTSVLTHILHPHLDDISYHVPIGSYIRRWDSNPIQPLAEVVGADPTRPLRPNSLANCPLCHH